MIANPNDEENALWAKATSITSENFTRNGIYKLEIFQNPAPRTDRDWKEETIQPGKKYYWRKTKAGYASQWERPTSMGTRELAVREAPPTNIILKCTPGGGYEAAYVYLIPGEEFNMKMTRCDHEEKLEAELKRVLKELREDPDSLEFDEDALNGFDSIEDMLIKESGC